MSDQHHAVNSVALTDPIRPNLVWRGFRLMCRIVFLFWMRYRARGLEHLPPGGALLLINHQSHLDPLLVGLPLQRPVSYIARESLFRVPFVGWFLKNTYAMPINREAAGTESIREAVRRMHHGFLVGVFPEGTRSPDGRLGELKPGFIALVRRAGAPVIPVGVAGSHSVMPRGAVVPRRRMVCVVFGERLSVDEVARLSQRGREHEFVTLVRERLEACLAEAEAWRTKEIKGRRSTPSCGRR